MNEYCSNKDHSRWKAGEYGCPLCRLEYRISVLERQGGDPGGTHDIISLLMARIVQFEKAMRELPANVRINNLGAHLEPKQAAGDFCAPKESHLPWPTAFQLWSTLCVKTPSVWSESRHKVSIGLKEIEEAWEKLKQTVTK